MTLSDIRKQALALQAQLDALDDVPWPPAAQAIVNRSRAELAVILAAADDDLAMLLEAGGVQAFEALRGLLRRQ